MVYSEVALGDLFNQLMPTELRLITPFLQEEQAGSDTTGLHHSQVSQKFFLNVNVQTLTDRIILQETKAMVGGDHRQC
jgi:hypothetical protein